jgi:hypothetical protein
MQYELMRTLAVMADPLHRLGPANSITSRRVESGAQRSSSETEEARSAQLKPASRQRVYEPNNLSRLSGLFSDVAAKWWLLFSVGP